MAETNALLAGQEPTLNIEDEVIFLDSLNEVETLSTLSPVKMDYNAIVHCRRGRVLLELGGSQQVKVTAGQMLLVPAQKLMHPMMVSTDVDAGVLLVSDSVLKSVLGTQIDIWNRAMYLHETYVIDISRWSHAMESHAHSVFKGENLALFREFVLAFLRVYLLKLDKCYIVTAETVLIYKEWNEDAVNVEDEIFTFYSVEDIIVEMEEYFSFYAMGFPDTSNFKYVFSPNHIRSILAPSALRRASMFS
jgi:hypothetical protein